MEFACLKATEPLRGDSLLLPLGSQEFLVFIGWKVELTLDSSTGFDLGTISLRDNFDAHYQTYDSVYTGEIYSVQEKVTFGRFCKKSRHFL